MSKTVEEMARELAKTNMCPDSMAKICPIVARGKICIFVQTSEQCWLNKASSSEVRNSYAKLKGTKNE